MKLSVPKSLKKAAQVLNQAGFDSYLVGGAVRDQLIGRKAKDFDIATDAKPKEVMKLFKQVIPTGIKHGTVTVLFEGDSFEITTFRLDGKYSDGRRPDSIHFTPSIEEDLKRRDFTINSIAYDINNDKLIDPNGGIEDLKNGTIRAIGIPEERFNEDGLRSLRACRFAAQLQFSITPETVEGIKKTLHRIPGLSPERIYEEIKKTMIAPYPSITFKLLQETGILKIILPELENCVGVTQKGSHEFDVFEHSIYSCDGVMKGHRIVRIAALFHDIGKPQSMKIVDGIPTFHNHEIYSAKIAKKILERLRFPKKDQDRICHLIEHHMFHYEDNWSDAAVRRFIARVKEENLDDIYLMRQGDIWGTAKKEKINQRLEKLISRVDSVLKMEHALTLKDLDIDGKILHDEAGIPRSFIMGKTMDFLLESVLEDPTQNNREKLLEIAQGFYNYHWGN